MAIPGQPLAHFDISFVDQNTAQYFLADRSNKAIDIFDAKSDRYSGRMGTFVGAVSKDGKIDNDISGPDGVVTVGQQLWAGDGDSTVKVIDLPTGKTVATIPTGGKTRVDELAIDPKDHVFIGVNNAEDPPFATLISTEPDHKIVGRVVFPDATDGAEQPAYNPDDGLFYMTIPELKKEATHGAIAVIDPRAARLVKMLPVDNCHPAGLAFGPKHNFVLGCGANGKEMPAVTIVMNSDTGAVIATVAGVGGTDMVAYSRRNNQYYTASSRNQGGPVLGVVDAVTNRLVQTIPIAGGIPHSVAASEATGHVYVPVAAVGGGDGTVHVYAPAE
jgi:DNA-binding beta-propeller fold protein YncE